jgi:hypothetical protein
VVGNVRAAPGFSEFIDQVTGGLTLYVYGRSGGVFSSAAFEVASTVEAERELAYWWRRHRIVGAVLLEGGVRIAEWGHSE